MIEVGIVFLFLLLLVLFFILLSLFIYLMIEKYINNQSRKKINELKETYRLDMFHFLQTGKDDELSPVGSSEKFIAFLELLSEYANVLDSMDVKQKISEYAKKYFTNHIKKELKKRRWSLRMNALYMIEDFHMDHLNSSLHELYNKKNLTIAEKAQILRMFAKFNDNRLTSYLQKSDPGLSDFSILTILSIMNEDNFEILVEDFVNLDKRTQFMIIDTIGKEQLIQYHPLLAKLLESNEEEMRIRALKAYSNMGAPIDKTQLAEFFSFESWQVRMMAAKVAGTQKLTNYKGKLIELLSDQEYVVRAEAAKAIIQFKDGFDILKQVIDETEDDFARDMALEWHEKKRVDYY
ncbi:HEAT repeat domain-containing protein [Metabacillus litoralis]|uniref:HEAT repeat domain-containing protein n=1 Tax=Metabacillus litoralis TaxID=152268 RepID=UPI001CFC8219|nr:HEAT repeat domain-containing protein [Metabacillus litoralis]